MQHFLKAATGAAGTKVIASEFFYKFLVAPDEPEATLYVCFGWEAFAAFTAALERRID
jgi:hypothetical protein